MRPGRIISSSLLRPIARPSPSATTARALVPWPTLPQTLQQIRLLSDETRQAIEKAIASAPIVLFMKGTPEAPACGFSNATVQVLAMQGIAREKFAAYNVFESGELREGIKEYSQWPTIPQLYVDKEFIGGCDVLLEMHKSGELVKLLEEKKLLAAGEEEGRQE